MAMRKRADGIVPLCDLAAREKTSVSGVVEELLQGWLEGTHKLEGILSIKFNRITQRKTPPSPVGFFVSYESGGRFSGGVLCPPVAAPRRLSLTRPRIKMARS